MSNFIYYEKLEDYEEQVRKAKECDEKDKEIGKLAEELEEQERHIKEADFEIERLNNIINGLNKGIKELDDMFYETFRISQNGYYSISEWVLKEFTDKIKELKGSEKE